MKKSIKVIATLMAATMFSLAACDKKTERNPVDETPVVTPETKTYVVKFNTNGGSTVKAVVVEENSRASKPADPTKDGYTFDGWYLDEACTNRMDFARPITSNVTLYAKWVENAVPPVTYKYTVTFDTNGGSTIASVEVDGNAKVTKPTNPTKQNYTFGGWYVDAGLTTPADFNAPITANTTFYAKWNLIEVPPVEKYYTVQFSTNGGSTIASVEVKENAKVTKPSDPTKEGYKFVGWYKDMGLNNPMNFDTPITSNLTLYAKWEKTVNENYGLVDRDVLIPKKVNFSTEVHTSTNQAVIDCGSLRKGSYNQSFDNSGDECDADGIRVMKYRYNVSDGSLNLFADNTYFSNTLYHGREGAIYNVDPIGGINQISVTYTATYSSTQNKGYSFSGDEIIKPNIRFGTNPKCEDYVYFLDPTSNSATCNVNLSGYHYFSVNTGTYNLSLNTITVDYDDVSISTPTITEASGLNKKRINPTRYTYPLVAGESKITVPLETTYNEATNTYTVTKSKELTYYDLNYVRNHPECTNDAAITDPILICAYYTAFKAFPANFEGKNNMSNARNVFGDKARQVSVPYTRTDGYARAVPCHLGEVYYEFDIDLDGSYSSSRGTGRVVAWETGWTGTGYDDSPVCIYTDDHYSTFIEYLNNGTWSNRFNAQGYISGIKHSPADTVSLTGFNPNMVEGTSGGQGGEGGGGQGGGGDIGGGGGGVVVNDNDYYANFAPIDLINENTARFQQVTNGSGLNDENVYILGYANTGNTYPEQYGLTYNQESNYFDFTNDYDRNEMRKMYFELVSSSSGYIYRISNNGQKSYLGYNEANPKDILENRKTLFFFNFDSSGNFIISSGNYAIRYNTTYNYFRFYNVNSQSPIRLYRYCDVEGAMPPVYDYKEDEFKTINSASDINTDKSFVIVSEKNKTAVFSTGKYIVDYFNKDLKVTEESNYTSFTLEKHDNYDLYALNMGLFYLGYYSVNGTNAYVEEAEEPTYFKIEINSGYVKFIPMIPSGDGLTPFLIDGKEAFINYDKNTRRFGLTTDTTKLDTRIYQYVEPSRVTYKLVDSATYFTNEYDLLLVSVSYSKCFMDLSNGTYRVSGENLIVSSDAEYVPLHVTKHPDFNVYSISFKFGDETRYITPDEETGTVYTSSIPYYFYIGFAGDMVYILLTEYVAANNNYEVIGYRTDMYQLNFDENLQSFRICSGFHYYDCCFFAIFTE